MSIRWKLFAVANYLFLAIFLFLFIKSIKYITDELYGQTEVIEFLPIFLSQMVIILNSFLNIYIFHKYMPEKPFSNRLKTIHLVSAILFIISIVVILISVFPEIKPESNPDEDDKSYMFFTRIFFFLSLLLSGYIAINQFFIKKYIQKRSDLSFDKMVNEIGSEE